MSGKSAGKERNRAAQSEQHGYQEPKDIKTEKRSGETEVRNEKRSVKERVLQKLKGLEERRRDQEGE